MNLLEYFSINNDVNKLKNQAEAAMPDLIISMAEYEVIEKFLYINGETRRKLANEVFNKICTHIELHYLRLEPSMRLQIFNMVSKNIVANVAPEDDTGWPEGVKRVG